MGWVIGACGAFSMCGAVFGWKWFMNHPKARLLTRIFGYTGARVFYGLLGALLIAIGGLMVAGVLR